VPYPQSSILLVVLFIRIMLSRIRFITLALTTAFIAIFLTIGTSFFHIGVEKSVALGICDLPVSLNVLTSVPKNPYPFFEGKWQDASSSYPWEMDVEWKDTIKRYEGHLTYIPPGLGSYGFTLGEVVWKAIPTSDSQYHIEQSIVACQKLRYEGGERPPFWLQGTVPVYSGNPNIIDSTVEKLVRLFKPRTVEDVLVDAMKTPVQLSQRVDNWSKEGGFERANKDFDSLKLNKVQDRGNGLRTGQLPDGTYVNVRPFSSGDLPTLEIQYNDKPTVKIRYSPTL
jgi:hypothetical protein